MGKKKSANSTDFVRSQGVFFLAHVMRRVSDQIVKGCEPLYEHAGLTVAPRTASTLHFLHRHGPSSITEVSAAIGQSHPLTIGWIQQLSQQQMVQTQTDPHDLRRTLVSLTAEGTLEIERMLALHAVFETAYKEIASESDADVFEAVWRLENALRDSSFGDRLMHAHAQLKSAR